MDLANNSIAGNASAEFCGNLTGAKTIAPQFAQQFNAFISPGHAASILGMRVAIKRVHQFHIAPAQTGYAFTQNKTREIAIAATAQTLSVFITQAVESR
jgi:hypothetical protein